MNVEFDRQMSGAGLEALAAAGQIFVIQLRVIVLYVVKHTRARLFPLSSKA